MDSTDLGDVDGTGSIACSLTGRDSTGKTWTLPYARLGSKFEGGYLTMWGPTRLVSLTLNYARPSKRVDGYSCANPYVGFFGGLILESPAHGARRATGLRGEIVPEMDDLTYRWNMSWNVAAGYRLCRVVVSRRGKPLTVMTSARSGKVALLDRQTTGPLVEFMYITVAKNR